MGSEVEAPEAQAALERGPEPNGERREGSETAVPTKSPTSGSRDVPGRLTYAIGDIHGRYDLLLDARDAIATDAGERGADVVCLGDYVDRGPWSRQVVEDLMQGPWREGDTLTCIKGNHEAIMLDAYASGAPHEDGLWIGNGGIATLSSYGRAGVPKAHLDWMASLPLVLHTTGRLFVHAGFMPGVALSDQQEEVVIWIRDRFLLAEKDFTDWPHIVHGHTPVHPWKRDASKPELLGWRTNLDTGAFHTGVLTVAVFEGEGSPPVRLLSVSAKA